MGWLFSRHQEIARTGMNVTGEGTWHVDFRVLRSCTEREEYKHFQAMFVTMTARLLHQAGAGEEGERLLAVHRSVFDALLGQVACQEHQGAVEAFRALRVAEAGQGEGEGHVAILKRRSDNSVFCDLRGCGLPPAVLRTEALWSLVKHGQQRYGPRVPKDLSDALHRMARFYRDMPWWGQEGLYTVPRLTLGIMRK